MNFSATNTLEAVPVEKIAIIGMAFQLPGAADAPENLWQMLCEGRSGITEIPADRFSTARFYDENPDALAKSYTKWAGILPQIDQFDPKFFGLAPREADSMDPQQRLLLQTVYGAIEDARYKLDTLATLRTGVFVGVSQSDYKTMRELNPAEDEKYAGTGYAMSIVANRVSHRLNLKGPSFSVDTACSSSLVALDQGVRNLQAGTCDLAFVGGVNVIAHPGSFVAFSKAGMLSPTGELSSFDKAANGYVRGEGVGVVLLKPYAKALQDGDQIHAVIEATSVNQDGQTGTMTAPSQAAQIDVINQLFQQSGRKPEEVGYAEAHGTGTPIGDPIEAGSIGQAIGRRITDRKLYLGSIKPNVGHLESAAGMAGLVKAVLALKKAEIPPNYRFTDPNPAIPLDALNLEVPVVTTPFPQVNGQRRAIVNSFGFGGTNASVLIASPPHAKAEPATDRDAETSQDRPVLVPLSAASPAALAGNAAGLLRALQAGDFDGVGLTTIAASLAARPAHFAYRAVILCKSYTDLATGLEALSAEEMPEEMPPNVRSGQVKRGHKIVFTYSGQGNQSWDMARTLLANEPVFREAITEFDTAYAVAAGWSILEEMAKDEAETHVNETWVTQPALVAVQYGLAALWRHWGVTPDVVMGHSVGEVAASINSGAVSLTSGVQYLAKRSTIREHMSIDGAMAAVGLPPDDVEALLPDNGLIDIGGRNGPGATSISGEKAAVHAFVDEFKAIYPDAFIRLLNVDSAWHSHLLDEAEDWLRAAVGEIDWQPPTIDFLSTVTAKLESRLDLEYCWKNLRQTVRYMDAVEAAVEMGGNVFVEIGPHTTLRPLTLSTALQMGASVDAVSSMSHKHDDLEHFAQAAADLFVLGVDLDWAALYGTDAALDLPGYAWDNDRYWKGSEEAQFELFEVAEHPLLGIRQPGALAVWTHEFDINTPAFLKEHRYRGEALFPAAGYVDVMLAAGRSLFPGQVTELEDCLFQAAFFLPPQGSVQIQTVYHAGRGRIEIRSHIRDSGEDWTLRASAFLHALDVQAPGKLAQADPVNEAEIVPDIDAFYTMLDGAGGVGYGPAFRTIKHLHGTGSRAAGRIALDESCRANAGQYVAHPALLDGVLQTLSKDLWLDVEMGSNDTAAFLPTGIARVRCYGALPADVRVSVFADTGKSLEEGQGQIEIADEDGQILLSVSGLRAKEMPQEKAAVTGAELPPDFIVEEFDPVELDLSASGPLTGRWIVLGEDVPQISSLMSALETQGAHPERFGFDTLGIDITDGLADMLIAAADEADPELPIAGIVFGWGLVMPELASDSDAKTVFEAVRGPVQALIEMGIALHDVHGETQVLQVVVLTQGARKLATDTQVTAGVAAAPLVATTRTLSSELPEISLRHIDCGTADVSAPDRLAKIILSATTETEIVLREDAIFAARLKVRQHKDLPSRSLEIGLDSDTNFCVTMPAPGVIDRLDLFECPRPELGAGEVRIRIRAVGLNFRDIMAVTALLPEEAEPDHAWQNLGLEFAGDIVEVGEGVTEYAVGHRVMGMGRNCLQRFLVVEAAKLILMHDGLDYDAAATVPSAFATAHYAINEVGRLGKGEKILIHVATGGVGLAAVQMAQAAGAEIFATAGSDAKRAVLRELGVPHVMNSRSLDYADRVMELTDGAGVDVILNSLPGTHIDKGLSILAPYGRFLEIGKRDVYADRSVGMKALRSNVSFNVIDLAAMGEQRPDLLAHQMKTVMERIKSGVLKPLPSTTYAVSDVRAAFRFMSQAQHVGKVVITFDKDQFTIREDRNKPVTFKADASYLITGGTRGFTLALADWMSKQGAGKLLLASRSGRVADEDRSTVETMEARGTQVVEVTLDVTDEVAVTACVLTAAADVEKPLAGILHGAAVIKDALLTMMTPEVLEEVLRPKVLGGWALHRAELALDRPLDFLVGFSSVAQAIGALGQSNYVAANSFLDALADYRGQLGLQGGTLDWGVIADAGFVARDEQLASYLETAGMAGLRVQEAEHALATLLHSSASRLCFARGDWQQVGRANIALGRAPRFKSMISDGGKNDSDLAKRLAPLSGEALETEIAIFVTTALSELLKVELSATDIDMPMSDAGLDSLSSFELKMRLETDLGISIMVSHFLKAPTISELSKVLASTFEAERDKRAALGEASEDGAQGRTTAGLQRRQFSDAQEGVVKASVARFTSLSARTALETRTTFDLLPEVKDGDIQEAVYGLFAEFPLIGLTCAVVPGEVPVLALGDAPRLSKGHLASDQTLDVLGGELLRIGREDDTMQIVMHTAVGDASALDQLEAALISLLAGNDVVPDDIDSLAHLCSLAYQPETEQALKDRSFWDHCLRDIPGPVTFSKRSKVLVPEAMGFDHGPAIVIKGRLAKQVGEAWVMASFASALRQISGDPCDVLIARQSDARPQGSGFGPFTVTMPIIVPVQPKGRWAQIDFERRLEAVGSHLAFDIFAALDDFSARFDAVGARPHQIGFQWSERLGANTPTGTIHDVRLDITPDAGGLVYRFTFDSDVVLPVERDAIVAAFESLVETQVGADSATAG